MRILWRSWSKAEAAYELAAMSGHIDWLNGHLVEPEPNDIWLTTNGYDHRNDAKFKQMTWYAESINYLAGEYHNFNRDSRWTHRFHFNPNYQASQQLLGCWWLHELDQYHQIKEQKTIDVEFGMVHGHKPITSNPYDFGHIRSKIVEACKTRSFKYYGSNWEPDKNYGGQVFFGDSQTPDKFKDARRLMAPAKFVFCTENLYDAHYSVNYLTEKIFNGFLAYAVPIYAGCFNVENFIDKSLFIDMRDFNFDVNRIIVHCEKITQQEYEDYLDRIDNFLLTKAQEYSFNNRLIELDDKIRKLARIS